MANNLLKKNDLLGKKKKEREEKSKKEKIDKKIVIPVIAISVAIIGTGIFLISHFAKKSSSDTPTNESVSLSDEIVDSTLEQIDLSDITKSTIQCKIQIDDKTYTNNITVEYQNKDNNITELLSGTKNNKEFKYMYKSDKKTSKWYIYNNGKYEIYEGDIIQNTIDVPSIINNIFMYKNDNEDISSQLLTDILPDDNIYYTYSVPYNLEKTDNGYKLLVSENNVIASNINGEGDNIIIKKIDIMINIENIKEISTLN